MAQNEFTKKNARNGVPGQLFLNAGINVFALELLVESFTKALGKETKPLEFVYKGVKLRIQIDENAE